MCDCTGWGRRYSKCCFSNFVFLIFAVLSLRFDSDSVAQHNLYVKEHKVRAEKSSHRPLDRTLFVLNIPPYCSEVPVVKLTQLMFFFKEEDSVTIQINMFI